MIAYIIIMAILILTVVVAIGISYCILTALYPEDNLLKKRKDRNTHRPVAYTPITDEKQKERNKTILLIELLKDLNDFNRGLEVRVVDENENMFNITGADLYNPEWEANDVHHLVIKAKRWKAKNGEAIDTR